MHKNVNQLISIEREIQEKIIELNYSNYKPKIIAVSKTFNMSDILPLINHGQRDFGENKVQEAMEKWTDIKNNFPNIKLHMIGKLQTNKVKYVIPLFDYIHSLDNIRLAEKIADQQIKFKKELKIFIQVNIGEENQKFGINKDKANDLIIYCKKINLDVIGLMCIPPVNIDPTEYFKEIYLMNKKFLLSELSMGMSSDYLQASQNGATYLRIGSSIFGERF